MINRRYFLKLAGIGSVSIAMTGCGAQPLLIIGPYVRALPLGTIIRLVIYLSEGVIRIFLKSGNGGESEETIKLNKEEVESIRAAIKEGKKAEVKQEEGKRRQEKEKQNIEIEIKE